MKVDVLRLLLPPWPGVEAPQAEVRCGWRDAGGTWHDGGVRTLDAVARDFRPKRLEACLHPADAPMAAFSLPPLSGRRLRAAVQGAIEPCALQPLEALVTGFGPRSADGSVPVAWTGRTVIDGWLGLLRRHGLALRELQLPAAFLPYSGEGWTACLIDRWIVVRTGSGQGFMQWLPEGMDHVAGLAAHAGGDTALPAVRWVGDDDDASARWSGQGWSWSLQAGESAGRNAALGMALAGPIAGWAVVAIAVWLTGLNVYAARLATQGQALKRQMAARVKAAFPDVPVVVNPLQQARQQLDARAAGAPQGNVGSDYAGLSRAAVNLLAQAPGQVQGLRYAAGELRIQWREGAAPNAQARLALQAQAKEQGLAVAADADVLRVTAAPGKDAQ
ncbi:MAG TPA: type II secretion system protein GspL [Variovorax sp.]